MASSPLRELHTNIQAKQSNQVQELRHELQAAKHENASLRTSLSRSNESLGRLSSEVWRFDTERAEQLRLLRQASVELCAVVRTLGLADMHSGTSVAETAEQSLREMQAATRALREAAAKGKLVQREELAAEQERLARAAQAIQVTQLRAARARELRRRQETCDALTLTLAPTPTPTLTLTLTLALTLTRPRALTRSQAAEAERGQLHGTRLR